MAMQLYMDEVTSYGQSYTGAAEKCVFTFRVGPEQLDFINNWFRSNYVNEQIKAIEEQGGRVLRIRLWRDTAPTWHTDYKGEIVADVSNEFDFQSPFPWVFLIGLAIASVLTYFLIRPTVESVSKVVWGPGGESFPWLIVALGAVVLIMLLRRPRRRET